MLPVDQLETSAQPAMPHRFVYATGAKPLRVTRSSVAWDKVGSAKVYYAVSDAGKDVTQAGTPQSGYRTPRSDTVLESQASQLTRTV